MSKQCQLSGQYRYCFLTLKNFEKKGQSEKWKIVSEGLIYFNKKKVIYTNVGTVGLPKNDST